MNTSALQKDTEFQWLDLSAHFEFKTVSSVSFSLGVWTNRQPSGGGTFTGRGWIEVHHPVGEHPVSDDTIAWVRLSLPTSYLIISKQRLSEINQLIFEVFVRVGIPQPALSREGVLDRRGFLFDRSGFALCPLLE